MRLSAVLTIAAACALLSGCGGSGGLEARRGLAAQIGAAGRLAPLTLRAGIFDLAAFERLEKPGAPARVYIEGDGLAWLSPHEISPNPTPRDPLALRLAAADAGANVVYLARPCQYGALDACPETYWTNGRTAPEVVAAYQAALDMLRRRGVTGFELVGYSGGAAVAVLVAAGRGDVLSVRTVAGNTDYAEFARIHGTSALDASVPPESAAMKISALPQMHFTGGRDKVVPAEIFTAWKKESGGARCVGGMTVAGNSHDAGWAEKWPGLLAVPVGCGTP